METHPAHEAYVPMEHTDPFGDPCFGEKKKKKSTVIGRVKRARARK